LLIVTAWFALDPTLIVPNAIELGLTLLVDRAYPVPEHAESNVPISRMKNRLRNFKDVNAIPLVQSHVAVGVSHSASGHLPTPGPLRLAALKKRSGKPEVANAKTNRGWKVNRTQREDVSQESVLLCQSNYSQLQLRSIGATT
jgi:hypothetical protein